MAFLDRESPVSEKAMIGVLLSALGYVVWHYSPLKDTLFRQTMTSSRVEQELMASPTVGAFANDLKTYYPSQFKTTVDRYSEWIRRGDKHEVIQTNGAALMNQFLASKMGSVVHAPDDDLLRVVEAQATLFQTLRGANQAACAQAAVGAGGAPTLSSDELAKAIAVTQALVRAAYDGERTPVARNVNEVGNTEDKARFNALIIQQGMTPYLARIAGSPDFASARPEFQCEIGYATYTAIALLPPKQAVKFMVAVLAANAPKT